MVFPRLLQPWLIFYYHIFLQSQSFPIQFSYTFLLIWCWLLFFIKSLLVHITVNIQKAVGGDYFIVHAKAKLKVLHIMKTMLIYYFNLNINFVLCFWNFSVILVIDLRVWYVKTWFYNSAISFVHFYNLYLFFINQNSPNDTTKQYRLLI